MKSKEIKLESGYLAVPTKDGVFVGLSYLTKNDVVTLFSSFSRPLEKPMSEQDQEQLKRVIINSLLNNGIR